MCYLVLKADWLMTLPSKEVVVQVSAVVALLSGVLKLLPLLFKRLSFLGKPWARYPLSVVALCSLGFYGGYLYYERRWSLADQVQAQIYDFSVKQAGGKKEGNTWCQWMLDAQDTTFLKKNGLVIFEQLSLNDFLYEGKEARPRVGFLSAPDGRLTGEPQGRMAVAIYNYDLGGFPASSAARLVLTASKSTSDAPPRIAVIVNDHQVDTIRPSAGSKEYSIKFPSRYLSPWNNYIYLQPSFDEMQRGKSKLLYLDSLEITTY
jgi:hypothetical protein